MELLFVVFCVFLGSLFFRAQRVPPVLVDWLIRETTPTNLVVQIDAVSVGFLHGLEVVGLRVAESSDTNTPVVTAARLIYQPLARQLYLEELAYPRLPAAYYAPGNHERNAVVDFAFPAFGSLTLTLVRPDILGIRAAKVRADVDVNRDTLAFDRVHLDWPDSNPRMAVDGFCRIDLAAQEVYGEVRGTAIQRHIRPLLEALDIESSFPYFDAFTEVVGPVPAVCTWKVNLINNDFDMDLDLHPTLGKYNQVPLTRADGMIRLHVYTRGDHLNYHHTIGPVTSSDRQGRPLVCTIGIDGTNGYNRIRVDATSAMPVAHLLKIGGLVGDYMDESIFGQSTCSMEFHFPEEINGDCSKLNGTGKFEIKDGQVMRMHGFRGLLDLLADKVPGVSWLTDSTQMISSYVIENGVVKTDETYIEGPVFSIKMYGAFDIPKDRLDFTVRVQFTKKDSFMGKILHPITWPFTKLLLEFRLKGSSGQPQWEYISVIDRVVEAVK